MMYLVYVRHVNTFSAHRNQRRNTAWRGFFCLTPIPSIMLNTLIEHGSSETRLVGNIPGNAGNPTLRVILEYSPVQR